MNSDWLSSIKDGVHINELALPGTHDAASWTKDEDAWTTPGTWAQRHSISEQLDLGVRVLDLRVGWTRGWNWYIGMYHNVIYVGLTLEDVLNDIQTWLTQHPREFVILIFQQQGATSKADLSKELRQMVRDTFGDALHRFDSTQIEWPTVGELRGKVLGMGRLKKDVPEFCDVRTWLTDGNNTNGVVINAGTHLRIFLQDRYSGISKQDGYESIDKDNKKKFAIVKEAATAVPNVLRRQLLRINHMSYSNLRYQPYESGEGMNTLLRKSNLEIRGVLMLDDADDVTVSHVLKQNDQHRQPVRRFGMQAQYRAGRGWEV